MRFWEDTFQGDDSHRRLTRGALIFGVIFFFVTCMLGLHSHSTGHNDAPASSSSTVLIVDAGGHDAGAACAGCGEHDTDDGFLLLCGLVLIAVFGVILMRPSSNQILQPLRWILPRTVDPPDAPPRRTPLHILLSISRT